MTFHPTLSSVDQILNSAEVRASNSRNSKDYSPAETINDLMRAIHRARAELDAVRTKIQERL